jgi:hypothetical protein
LSVFAVSWFLKFEPSAKVGFEPFFAAPDEFGEGRLRTNTRSTEAGKVR